MALERLFTFHTGNLQRTEAKKHRELRGREGHAATEKWLQALPHKRAMVTTASSKRGATKERAGPAHGYHTAQRDTAGTGMGERILSCVE